MSVHAMEVSSKTRYKVLLQTTALSSTKRSTLMLSFKPRPLNEFLSLVGGHVTTALLRDVRVIIN